MSCLFLCSGGSTAEICTSLFVGSVGCVEETGPAWDQAWEDIVPVVPREGEAVTYDLVGPICETGDFLGKDRALVLQENDLLAVRSAGAYGFVMSSNYNTRCRAAEVMVDGKQAHLVRQREELSSLWALENVLPE